MATERTTIKTSVEARKLVKLIAAMTDEPQYRVMERALKAELERQKQVMIAKLNEKPA